MRLITGYCVESVDGENEVLFRRLNSPYTMRLTRAEALLLAEALVAEAFDVEDARALMDEASFKELRSRLAFGPHDTKNKTTG